MPRFVLQSFLFAVSIGLKSQTQTRHNRAITVGNAFLNKKIETYFLALFFAPFWGASAQVYFVFQHKNTPPSNLTKQHAGGGRYVVVVLSDGATVQC
jgi:hypothetical protein